VLAISAALIAGGMPLGAKFKNRLGWPLAIGWLLLYPAAILLLRGAFGLAEVPTRLWGGLLVTVVLASTAIVVSFPLGILLALGRRSDYPIIKYFCIGYIELIRGVPLVSVLYMGSLLLPLFLPGGENIDQLVRAMVAVTLFSAAYLAEDVRGGLQSLSSGQAEAARALGLNAVQATLLITLPQALRNIVPMLVGHAISMLKDTSLVAIVGLYDLLGAAQSSIGQQQWLGIPGGVWRETFLTIAIIFFVINFTMSRVSAQIERNIARSRQ
jgi:general L-amino acid transport system permease protein